MRPSLLATCVLLHAAVLGRELDVPADYATIGEALDAARDGDAVLIAPGTYSGPANRDLDFRGKSIELRGLGGAEATVIDCEGKGRGFLFQSGETRRSVVAGVTVRDGSAESGAAILCVGASPAISGCRFVSNRALQAGGAVAATAGSSPRLSDSFLEGNEAPAGGAVVCADPGTLLIVTGCRVTGNVGSSIGGGVLCRDGAELRMVDCIISGNRAGSGGGGAFFLDGGRGHLADSRIVGNASGGNAGGVCCLVESSPTFERCVISGNRAGNFGGGVSCESETDNPLLINCLFTGNAAGNGGGALGCHNGASPRVLNCTIADNAADAFRGVHCDGEASPEFVNTILWSNGDGPICGVIVRCLVDRDPQFRERGVFDFTRFLDDAPELPDFVVAPGDYRLREGSPALDGAAAEVAPPQDLEGNRRPCGDGADVGAFEGCSEGAGRFIRGDANADGRVDISDPVQVLVYLFRGLRAPPCRKSADADDSGSVDLADAVFLLRSSFLGGPPPPGPARRCGVDPTEDGLSCRRHAPCEP